MHYMTAFIKHSLLSVVLVCCYGVAQDRVCFYGVA